MSAAILRILRVGPATTVQDSGRKGMLSHGVSAAGPMDREGFDRAGRWLGAAGTAGIEITRTGISFTLENKKVQAAFDGGHFKLTVNGRKQVWPALVRLGAGDVVDITPGDWGNYAYVRFDREIELPPVLGSRATSVVSGLGGLEGRALRTGDTLPLAQINALGQPIKPTSRARGEGPIRIVWGLHAEAFDLETRQRFVSTPFVISSRLDRMGVRLTDASGVFSNAQILSLVSDAVVPGDIQILGDGTPIVLARDHQPTGGYPRIATVVSADFDRFSQLRPGEPVVFEPVTPQKAHALLLALKAKP